MKMPERDFCVICLKASQRPVQNSTQREPQTPDSNVIHVKLRQTAILLHKHVHYSHATFSPWYLRCARAKQKSYIEMK